MLLKNIIYRKMKKLVVSLDEINIITVLYFFFLYCFCEKLLNFTDIDTN